MTKPAASFSDVKILFLSGKNSDSAKKSPAARGLTSSQVRNIFSGPRGPLILPLIGVWACVQEFLLHLLFLLLKTLNFSSQHSPVTPVTPSFSFWGCGGQGSISRTFLEQLVLVSSFWSQTTMIECYINQSITTTFL